MLLHSTNKKTSGQTTAHLKTPDNKLLEIGHATYFPAENVVEFGSEFVQLFKMGTVLQILLLKNDTEFQKFVGTVYVSNQKMLRIVDVTTEVFATAKDVHICTVSFNALFEGVFEQAADEKPKLFARKPKAEHKVFTGMVYGLSTTELCFSTHEEITTGQILTIKTDEPINLDVQITVTKVLSFGDNASNCICKITQPDIVQQAQLADYLEPICLKELTQ